MFAQRKFGCSAATKKFAQSSKQHTARAANTAARKEAHAIELRPSATALTFNGDGTFVCKAAARMGGGQAMLEAPLQWQRGAIAPRPGTAVPITYAILIILSCTYFVDRRGQAAAPVWGLMCVQKLAVHLPPSYTRA